MHVLYRFVDTSGRLLYVGVTKNPAARFRKHGQDQFWWDQVSAIHLERHASRELLMIAELEAIETEFPIFNQMGSTGKSTSNEFDVSPCPVCGKESFYRRSADRYYHTWGSDNRECWAKCSRGEIDVPVTNCHGRVLTRRTWP